MSTLDTIVSVVQAAVLAGVTGSRVSEESYDFLAAPGRSLVHLEFAVGVPGTAGQPDRQRVSLGAYVHHDIRVLLAYQLRPKDRPASYQTMITVEALARKAVMGAATTAGWGPPVYESTSRRPAVDGWMLVEHSFRVPHTLPIS